MNEEGASEGSSQDSRPKIARKRSLEDVNVYSKSIGVIQKPDREYSFLPELNRSVKLWRGDIDLIEVQHVVLPSSGEVARRLRERAGAQQLARARQNAYKPDRVFTTDAGDLPADVVVHVPTLKSLGKLRETMKELLRLCGSDNTR